MNMKKSLMLMGLFLPSFVFSANCPFATPSNSSSFCASFKVAAECHCTSSGLPKGMCINMDLLYDRMISMFGTLERACQFQHHTSFDVCVENWNCYRHGGMTIGHELCSGTGKACA